MTSFNWEDRYATGIAFIDEQHQELFRTMGRLHDAFRLGRGKQELGPILNFLSNYVQVHFSEEEAYMRKIQFPDLAFHRLEHQKLTAKVEHLMDGYAIDDPTIAMETSILLYEWLRDHILQHDFAYVAHAQATRQL